jgi:hypothetical protein
MSGPVSSKVGRRTLLAIVLFSMVSAFLTLFVIGRGGAINQQNMATAIHQLLQLYLPPLGIIAAFYFAERSENGAHQSTTVDKLAFAVIIVAGWVLVPPLALAASPTYMAAFRLIDAFAPFGNALGSGAIAYYFSKSS